MAYACPVCDSLAPDGEHLAHHLAIVAMSRGGDHEAWLDEHAEGWREERPETLAAFATERAEEVDHDLADATAGERPDVGHHHGTGHGRTERGSGGPGGTAPGPSDEATAEVLAEAREITQQMLGGEGDEARDGGESDGAAETGDAPTETDSDE